MISTLNLLTFIMVGLMFIPFALEKAAWFLNLGKNIWSNITDKF